ncbi:hypothetical protein D918_04356 [Trichuris suis]|nr:hypothetical protein D918_04356 [Trichuris suis]
MSQQQSGPYGNGDWLNHLSSPSSSDSPKLDDRHCYPFPSTSNSVAQPEQNRWSMAKSRYGHQQALDQIKQSLLPYHNAAATTAVTSAGAVSGGSSSSSGLHSTALSATAAAGSSSITPTCPDLATFSLHESAMLDNLVQMGFDKVNLMNVLLLQLNGSILRAAIFTDSLDILRLFFLISNLMNIVDVARA